MLTLTAATPKFKVYLTDLDVRWRQFAMASDDRTVEELDQSVYLVVFPHTSPGLREV